MKFKINRNYIYLFVAVVMGFALGMLFTGNDEHKENGESEEAAADLTYTCSMHPQIKKSEPGNCPICGMELVLMHKQSGKQVDSNALEMSEVAMQLANVQTSPVRKRSLQKIIYANGKVETDERYLYSQPSYFNGRIEELRVNFIGEKVVKGQKIASIYSPELVTAQKELLQTRSFKKSNPEIYQSAVDKLKNWKLTDKQIDQILGNGKPIKNFSVTAGSSGYVISKKVNEGDYVNQGQVLFTIADLSKVWVLFDLYESDFQWVQEGDSVSFEIESIAGKTFKARITYIDPAINPATRVARARAEISNPSLKLKPEMFANGKIRVNMEDGKEMLSIPESAILWTGRRSVVYVNNQSSSSISFKLREVNLGPKLGDYYAVESGLEEGEQIAIQGAFSIDAAAQLQGKPSMMSERESMSKTTESNWKIHDGHSHQKELSGEEKELLSELLGFYLKLRGSLAADQLTDSKENLKKMAAKIEDLSLDMPAINRIRKLMHKIDGKAGLKEIRNSFSALSNEVISLSRNHNLSNDKLYLQYCPMAGGNEGAFWLSTEEEINNPSFGRRMLKCGEVTDTIN